jgi:hypothetical protein
MTKDKKDKKPKPPTGTFDDAYVHKPTTTPRPKGGQGGGQGGGKVTIGGHR